MFNQKGTKIIPIEEENDEVKLYDSYEDADEEMKEHFYAKNFGYEIFEISVAEE